MRGKPAPCPLAVLPVAKARTATPPSEVVAGSSVFSARAWSEIARSLGLSVRELQIVQAVMDDGTELAIAGGLGISMHTVHTHVARLHRKLRVADRVGLVVRVLAEFIRLTLRPGSGLPPLCSVRTAGRCPLLPRRRS